MTDETSQQESIETVRERPAYRAWLVNDRADGKSEWIELSGLWPTKTANGFSGGLKQPVAATAGRIVILPAASNPTRES